MKGLVTAERFRKIVSYDPVMGIFTWLARPNSRVRAGEYSVVLLWENPVGKGPAAIHFADALVFACRAEAPMMFEHRNRCDDMIFGRLDTVRDRLEIVPFAISEFLDNGGADRGPTIRDELRVVLHELAECVH